MIKPINGMLLIKEQEAKETTTNAGIILAAAFADLGPKRGEVVAIGPGEINHFTGGIIELEHIKVGDIILYPDHSGVNVEENGNKYILLHNKHVMATIS